MDKRFCFAIAVLLVATALLCGCTSTSNEGATKSNISLVQTGVSSADGAKEGQMVEVDYTGTFENGTVFDSSKDRGPFSLVLGTGGAIAGFEKALIGMKVGESKKFTLSPDEAYGEYDPTRIVSLPIDFIPAEENVSVGDQVTLFNGGQMIQAKIMTLNATNVTFDLNSPLAGKALTFDVTVRNISDVVNEDMPTSLNNATQ